MHLKPIWPHSLHPAYKTSSPSPKQARFHDLAVAILLAIFIAQGV